MKYSTMYDYLDLDVDYLSNIDDPIYIYGFDTIAKTILTFCLSNDVYVDGFVVEDNKYIGSEFLNKRVYSLSLIANSHRCAVIDFLGDNLAVLEKFPNVTPYKLTRDVRDCNIVVYGAGYRGREMYKELSFLGINVLAYVDRDETKQGMLCCGKPILGVEALEQKFKDNDVLIALTNYDDARSVQEQLATVNERIYLFCDTIFSASLFLGKPTPVPVDVTNLRLFLKLAFDSEHTCLWGSKEDILFWTGKLALMDIFVTQGIAVDSDFIGEEDGVTFCSQYDLLYAHDGTKVIVLYGWQQSAEDFAKANELPMDMFISQNIAGVPERLGRRIVLDANLVHTIANDSEIGELRLHNDAQSDNPVVKLGILGGSTSDITFLNIKSWPEILLDRATQEGVKLEILGGGTAAYTGWQEIVKFIRDFSQADLDILVSYSGVNEISTSKDRTFSSDYLEDIFAKIDRTGNAEVYWGRKKSDFVRYWLHQEYMLKCMCDGLGIKFFAIHQPCLYTKRSAESSFDFNLREHIGFVNDWKKWERYSPHGMYERFSKLQLYLTEREQMGAYVSKFEWLSDFVDIFDEYDADIYLDECHLAETGNEILAKNVWNLIKPAVNSVIEQKLHEGK